LALDHRNVGLSQQRQEFTAERLAATEEAGAGDQFVKGMQQVVDEEQQLVRDLSRD